MLDVVLWIFDDLFRISVFKRPDIIRRYISFAYYFDFISSVSLLDKIRETGNIGLTFSDLAKASAITGGAFAGGALFGLATHAIAQLAGASVAADILATFYSATATGATTGLLVAFSPKVVTPLGNKLKRVVFRGSKTETRTVSSTENVMQAVPKRASGISFDRSPLTF